MPLYDKFYRKKNQDKLLENFYGLIPNANKYLNCPDSNAATVIMIEIPDRLAEFFKVCQNRENSCTTTASNDMKIEPLEQGRLSYIAGLSSQNFIKNLDVKRMMQTRNFKHCCSR